jgi:hypothetical protein
MKLMAVIVAIAMVASLAMAVSADEDAVCENLVCECPEFFGDAFEWAEMTSTVTDGEVTVAGGTGMLEAGFVDAETFAIRIGPNAPGGEGIAGGGIPGTSYASGTGGLTLHGNLMRNTDVPGGGFTMYDATDWSEAFLPVYSAVPAAGTIIATQRVSGVGEFNINGTFGLAIHDDLEYMINVTISNDAPACECECDEDCENCFPEVCTAKCDVCGLCNDDACELCDEFCPGHESGNNQDPICICIFCPDCEGCEIFSALGRCGCQVCDGACVACTCDDGPGGGGVQFAIIPALVAAAAAIVAKKRK